MIHSLKRKSDRAILHCRFSIRKENGVNIIYIFVCRMLLFLLRILYQGALYPRMHQVLKDKMDPILIFGIFFGVVLNLVLEYLFRFLSN